MPVFTKSVDERALALRLFGALHPRGTAGRGGARVVETTAAVVAAAGVGTNSTRRPHCARCSPTFSRLLEQTLPPPPSEQGCFISGWANCARGGSCGDNLWSLLPLVTELSPEQGLGAETLRMCGGVVGARGVGTHREV